MRGDLTVVNCAITRGIGCKQPTHEGGNSLKKQTKKPSYPPQAGGGGRMPPLPSLAEAIQLQKALGLVLSFYTKNNTKRGALDF